jgi:flagellar FliJ protein
MSDIKTLHKVVDLAEKRRDEARASLAQQQRELQIANDQLQQLQTYAQEAQQRWLARGTSTGVDAQQLLHQRQFMDKIDHALEFQRGVISNREGLIERCQQQLIAAERDVAGLRKYTERKLQLAQQQAQRQEQKATDEMALSIHLRQSLALAQARAAGARS